MDALFGRFDLPASASDAIWAGAPRVERIAALDLLLRRHLLDFQLRVPQREAALVAQRDVAGPRFDKGAGPRALAFIGDFCRRARLALSNAAVASPANLHGSPFRAVRLRCVRPRRGLRGARPGGRTCCAGPASEAPPAVGL